MAGVLPQFGTGGAAERGEVGLAGGGVEAECDPGKADSVVVFLEQVPAGLVAGGEPAQAEHEGVALRVELAVEADDLALRGIGRRGGGVEAEGGGVGGGGFQYRFYGYEEAARAGAGVGEPEAVVIGRADAPRRAGGVGEDDAVAGL